MSKLAAKQFGSASELEADLSTGGGATWIKYIGDEPLVVRFLEEPVHWVGYLEYFDREAKRAVPMEQNEEVPEGYNVSKRYLAEAVIIDGDSDNTDATVPLKLPKTLASDLYETMKLTGSITDRDFTLLKTGTGLKTVYKNLPAAPEPRDMSKYKRLDLIEILEGARAEALGQVSKPDPEDVDNSDEPETPVAEHTPTTPTEGVPTMEEMLAMERDELADVATKLGIEFDDSLRKGGLIDVLVNAGEA